MKVKFLYLYSTDAGTNPEKLVIIGTDNGCAIFFRYEGKSSYHSLSFKTKTIHFVLQVIPKFIAGTPTHRSNHQTLRRFIEVILVNFQLTQLPITNILECVFLKAISQVNSDFILN
jgi:hypothetical protein